MKLVVLVGLLELVGVLTLGFYKDVSQGEAKTVVFIKKSPTFQIEFFNVHIHNGEIPSIHSLSAEDRQDIISYCKYRLGYKTDLKNQADIEMCAKV